MRAKMNPPMQLQLLLSLLLLAAGNAAPAVGTHACEKSNAALSEFPFCNASLPTNERVNDYIARLTLQEKISLLVDTTLGVPRLGVPPYEWWNEALHGVSWSPGIVFGGSIPRATSFPMPNTMAASFNSTLFCSVGEAVSTEARALHNIGQAGLTFWSPNVNIYRDPRWGRGQETPGEDPLLSARYASQFVRGLQGNRSDDKLKVSACCKHLTAYDVDNSTGAIRYDFNALVTAQDLKDTYNVPFQGCVEDGAASCIMCSYNRLNGVPVCADRHLLTDTVRNAWKLNGYITTDRDSVQTYYVYTNYAASPQEAVADALLAGVNMNSGAFLRNYTMLAIMENKVSEDVVDRALAETTKVLMRVGFFDGEPTAQIPYGSIKPSDVCTQEHIKLALEASRQGIVLLKNINKILPLSARKIKKLAVVGPHANATVVLTGNYAGVPCRYTSPLQGFEEYTSVIYEPGCDVACKSDTLFTRATNAAGEADAVVLIMGLNLEQEAENLDRTSLLLPGRQQELASRVIQASKGPVVLVILSGGSIDVSFALNDDRVAGIIWAGYPGQEGGVALAEIVFGEYNPGGRLPTSWYPQSYLSINISNMNMRPDHSTGYPGRTYRFYTGPVLFEFGHGLGYTNVSAEFLEAPKLLEVASTGCSGTLKARSTVRITVKVRSEGAMAASYAMLLFSVPPDHGKFGIPRKQLAAFQRVWIGPNSSVVTVFELDPCKHMSIADENGEVLIQSGIHTLVLEDASHSINVQASSSAI